MGRVASPVAALVGSRIIARRNELGMTAAELSRRSGVSAANISFYENGRSLMNIGSLLRIAAALEIDPSVLLDGVQLAVAEQQQEG
ncbi:helix-turn-helix domain-containing protein [Micrococcus luteus]|uniref:helix-turn-helix domain-containing protein n=1 Tax=Micrococcus luteus TaxID=1270 RepID=UPI0022B3F1E1|nr:helix-turn-helix transcriptional regulator [Micrococcus luteus]